MRHPGTLLLLAAILAASTLACHPGRGARLPTVEPLATATPTPLIGGKPQTPPAARPPGDSPHAATPTPEAGVPTPGPPGPPQTPKTADGSLPPTEGHWIDVDVTRFAVRLMDGTAVLREIAPVAVGSEIDTGAYASTQTGLFHVYNKSEPLAYDPPYKTYISDWVGFDPDRANGFHSFLKDERGDVVDASTGRVSNGCIRTGDAGAIYTFAEIGMPVYVHF
jgi:hypothetical protein